MKSSRVPRSAFALLFALFLTGAAPQQNPPIPSLGETVEVSIVNLDVFVTNRDGNRIRGLTKNDFEIFENGKPKPISNFAEYSSRMTSASAGTDAARANAAPEQRRTIVLFFEAMKLSPAHSGPFVEGLKSTLRSVVRKGDAVSLVLWSGHGQVRADFTSDLASLERTLDAIRTTMTGGEMQSSWRLREDVAKLLQFEAELVADAITHGNPINKTLDAQRVGDVVAETGALTQLEQIRRKTHAINAVITSLAGSDGKKVLVLATRRLGDIAGSEFFYLAGKRTPTEHMRNKFGTEKLIDSIVDNANASGVTIYPFHPAGLADHLVDATSVLSTDSALEHLIALNETVSLRQLADRTGGLLASGSGDIVRILPRIADDVSDYYSLAYRVDGVKDRARDVVVKTKNRDYVVRARRQFVEKTDETRMKDRVTATLFQTFEQPAFKVTVDAGGRTKQGRNDVLPLKVRVPIKDLTLVPRNGKHAGAFSVYVASAVSLGEVSAVEKQTQTFEIAEADLARAKAGHFTYNFNLAVNGNVERVAVGVLDEVSKSYGLARVDLATPSAAQPSTPRAN